MKVKNIIKVANLVIILMLCIISVYLGTSSYRYVFSYQNGDVIYNGNRDSNKVSLMFNVYWGTEYIDDILSILDRYGAKTTFFVGGQWAEKENDKLADIVSYGHEIGNHGYFHKDQEYLDYAQNYDEISVNHNLIKSLTGLSMNLFAPPSGSFNKSTLSAASELGYQTVMWSRDTIDWRDKDVNLIFTRATSDIKGGDLILCHPTESTLRALPMILEYYKANNLICTTVTDCLSNA